MTWIRFWRLNAAEQETVEQITRPTCMTRNPLIPNAPACGERPYWVLAWTVDESGLPGMGEKRHDFVCSAHVERRLSAVPFEYAGSVTITPYKEVR